MNILSPYIKLAIRQLSRYLSTPGNCDPDWDPLQEFKSKQDGSTPVPEMDEDRRRAAYLKIRHMVEHDKWRHNPNSYNYNTHASGWGFRWSPSDMQKKGNCLGFLTGGEERELDEVWRKRRERENEIESRKEQNSHIDDLLGD